jgi:hypothetical protein
MAGPIVHGRRNARQADGLACATQRSRSWSPMAAGRLAVTMAACASGGDDADAGGPLNSAGGLTPRAASAVAGRIRSLARCDSLRRGMAMGRRVAVTSARAVAAMKAGRNRIGGLDGDRQADR